MINKQQKKHLDGKCCFCDENDYTLLDVHRIIPGEDGGKYTKHNSLTVCVKCHRLIHAGRIVVHRKYYNSSGHYSLHCEVDNQEKWISI